MLGKEVCMQILHIHLVTDGKAASLSKEMPLTDNRLAFLTPPTALT